jgi:hypothetical protein
MADLKRLEAQDWLVRLLATTCDTGDDASDNEDVRTWYHLIGQAWQVTSVHLG